MRITAMTDEEIQAILSRNVQSARAQIAAACHRAGRSPADVTRVAVTKQVSNRIAQMLVNQGVHNLGESRPQELWRKSAAVIGLVSWHLIGHLQRNKIDKTLPLVTLVHSVDSERLLLAINDWARQNNRTVDVLIEANVSGETAKTGWVISDVGVLAEMIAKLQQVRLRGMMTMAALQTPEACRPTFRQLRLLKESLERQLGTKLDHLSMGMSNDFPVAVEEGATIVRLGSCLYEGIPDEDLRA
jgi:pyridoxal phosphate enzyme (YggS family)